MINTNGNWNLHKKMKEKSKFIIFVSIENVKIIYLSYCKFFYNALITQYSSFVNWIEIFDIHYWCNNLMPWNSGWNFEKSAAPDKHNQDVINQKGIGIVSFWTYLV